MSGYSTPIHTDAPVAIDPRTVPTKGLSQAYALRDVAYQLAVKYSCNPAQMPEEEIERARSVTALIKAWAEADDRVRIHRGKPLPGSLRPAVQTKSKRGRDKSPAPAQPIVYPPPETQPDTGTTNTEATEGDSKGE